MSVYLAELGAVVRRAGDGQGSLALVRGEAGIGKTAVVEEAARAAADEGFRVRCASCWDGDGSPPFWPWVQILCDHLDETDQATLALSAPSDTRDLRRLMPGIEGSADPVPEPSSEERFRLFDTVASVVQRGSRTTPTLIVVDDLHRADPSSTELIRFLGSRSAAGRALRPRRTRH